MWLLDKRVLEESVSIEGMKKNEYERRKEMMEKSRNTGKRCNALRDPLNLLSP